MKTGIKAINRSLLFLAVLLLSACGPQDEEYGPEDGYVCLGDRQRERECDENEKATIDGIKAIIKSVNNFQKSDLEDHYFQRGEGKPDLYLFGENHTDAYAQTETLGAINFLAKNGGKIRLEGRDRQSPEFKGRTCALVLLGMVYLTEVYERLGRTYDPKERSDWVKQTRFWQTLDRTSLSYPLSQLNLVKLTCGYWDDKAALKNTLITRNSLVVRNQSLIETSKNNTPSPPGQVLVFLTGFSHTPLGEFLFIQKKNQGIAGFPVSLENYYVMVDAELRRPAAARRFLLQNDSSGTTRNIFDYLRVQGNFREMIHKSLIK